jgi:PAS domain S-box-containing protein
VLDDIHIHLVIADWLLPDGQGIDILPAGQHDPPFPVVLMTGHGNEQVAVEAMKAGALDYVVKSAETLADMPHLVQRALREWRYIAERRHNEQEIARLQHLLQNIADSMPSTLITLDAQGRVLTWNPAAEQLTGCTATQIKERVLWENCPALTPYRSMFDQVLKTNQIARRHRDATSTEQGIRYHDVSVFPLSADGTIGAVLRIDDVTQRVHLEEMMLQSTKMASVGGLAAGVAHELNNPLGAMMQSAQLLQMALDTQRPQTRKRLEAAGLDPDRLAAYLQERDLAQYLQGIREMGTRAAKIVSDLLSFSRKSASNPALRDLNTLIEQALELAITDYDLEKRYDLGNVEIIRDLAPNLPKVMCEGQQIQQVVLNLVRNAAQAMAAKAVTGKAAAERAGHTFRDANHAGSASGYQPRLIIHTAQPDPDRVRVHIEDNGPGIPEAIRRRIFEPFFTTKEVGEGTGLGLWLCWSIVVERHGGRIWLESAQGEGACFVFELPLQDAHFVLSSRSATESQDDRQPFSQM